MGEIINQLFGLKGQEQVKTGNKGGTGTEIKDGFTKGMPDSLSDLNALADFAKTKGIGDILFGKPKDKEKLDQAFQNAEKAIEGSKSGDIQKEASSVTKNFLSQVKEYAKATGKGAEAVIEDIKQFAITHPAVSITVLLGAGITVGALLEKYGVPESLLGGATNSLSSIKQQIKEHPFIAAGIGLGLAGGLAYLMKLAFTSPALEPPAADTPQKQKLVQSLDNLEKEVSESKSGDPKKAAEGIGKRFFDTVSEYAKSAGKTAKEAYEDVTGFMLAHPGVTASVILGAGVTGGILLQKAAVPQEIAFLAGTAFDSACAGTKSGLSKISETIKENPVISAVVISALAAGAGYLVYEYLNKK